MNENLDLTKILDGCPKGTKFYSPLFGEVKLNYIYGYRIGIECIRMNIFVIFNPAGKYEMIEMECSDGWGNYYYSDECLLFPSKDQRDWSKFERFWDKPKTDEPTVEMFDENTFKPFDKVLVRDFMSDNWMADFFENIEENDIHYNVTCVTCKWVQCIPYNEETRHLLRTREDCPEYYKWWEK